MDPGLLILTCTGVSFAHGSNDGQKGMGLIMLILIGAAPTAYALNRTMPDSATPAFVRRRGPQAGVPGPRTAAAPRRADAGRPATTVGDALRDKTLNQPAVFAALVDAVRRYRAAGQELRRDQPCAGGRHAQPSQRHVSTGDAVRPLPKIGANSPPAETKTLKVLLRWSLDSGTRFIPLWVKVCVAIALGLGTMVGWKRIVVTVGEKHRQDASDLCAGRLRRNGRGGTIGLADVYGLPVSTTHILSSGVAGTMAANGSGLQWSTVKHMALAWVLTLPAAMAIAGSLYVILRQIF